MRFSMRIVVLTLTVNWILLVMEAWMLLNMTTQFLMKILSLKKLNTMMKMQIKMVNLTDVNTMMKMVKSMVVSSMTRLVLMMLVDTNIRIQMQTTMEFLGKDRNEVHTVWMNPYFHIKFQTNHLLLTILTKLQVCTCLNCKMMMFQSCNLEVWKLLM